MLLQNLILLRQLHVLGAQIVLLGLETQKVVSLLRGALAELDQLLGHLTDGSVLALAEA